MDTRSKLSVRKSNVRDSRSHTSTLGLSVAHPLLLPSLVQSGEHRPDIEEGPRGTERIVVCPRLDSLSTHSNYEVLI